MSLLHLTTPLTHDEHGDQPLNYVLYASGWRAHDAEGRENHDRQDYEESGLYRYGLDGPLLDFAEVCEWLRRKGWRVKPAERIPSLKFSRGVAVQEGVVEHRSKDGRVKIVADSRDGDEPTLYRVWVESKQIEPPPKPRQRKFYDGWWRLKDAREAALNHLNGDPLPFSGKKPRVEKYDTYDPEKEGYGNEEQWRATFDARIDRNEADKILGGEAPEKVLELSPGATQAEIKRAYRRMIGKWHPDRHGNSKEATERATKIKAAYELLKE